MNNKITSIDVDKRESLKRNFENDYHLNKRNNFKIHCKGLRCEEYDDSPVNKESLSDEDTYNQCPGILTKRLEFKKLQSMPFQKKSLIKENLSIKGVVTTILRPMRTYFRLRSVY